MSVNIICYYQQSLFFIQVYINTSPTHEAHHKCKSAIKVILNKSEDFSAIEKLLTPSMPIQIMLHILIKISQVFSISYVIHT